MYKIIGILICYFYFVENREIATSTVSVTGADGYSKEPKIISRKEWGAKEPRGPVSDLSENPPSYVVVHHSATEGCTSQATCQARVRSFQNYHMNVKKWSDIGYNFLVGEDGLVYEGRGWSKRGAHAVTYNAKSIGICIIGDFTNREPNSIAIEALKDLIAFGVSKNEIQNNYHLIGHRQASATSCPGNKLFDLIKTFPHWENNP